ncbi:MAG: metal-dependent hydrolase [Candidatus Korarchaeota archaeon]
MFATSHALLGFVIALVLYKYFPQIARFRRSRWYFLGFLAGFGPDFDTIPGAIAGHLNEEYSMWTFHHVYTHTFIAMSLLLLLLLTNFNGEALLINAAWDFHLFCDWLDNSIMPFGPFSHEEWGLNLGYNVWQIPLPVLTELNAGYAPFYDTLLLPVFLISIIYVIYLLIKEK